MSEELTVEKDALRAERDSARTALMFSELRATGLLNQLNATPPPFVGSASLGRIIYDTLSEHIVMAGDGYTWCACEWRSQGDAESAGREAVIHQTNALHAALVPWVQARESRVFPPGSTPTT